MDNLTNAIARYKNALKQADLAEAAAGIASDALRDAEDKAAAAHDHRVKMRTALLEFIQSEDF